MTDSGNFVFGKTYLNANNHIDRKKLGALVFGNKIKLRLLNKAIHPILIKRIRQEIKHLENKHYHKRIKPLLVLEAAILYETKMDRLVDEVMVVYAPKSIRIKRIKVRDKLTIREIEARIVSQMPLKQKMKKAKTIIDNSGRITKTFKQVELMYTILYLLSNLKEMENYTERMQ